MHLHGMQGLPLAGTQTSAAGGGLSKGATASPRLVRAAHEFEGQLMEQLLKPMTDSDGLTGESVSGSAGALGSFASEALGQALSQEGGLGLADEIIRNLTPHEGPGASKSGTKSAKGAPGVTNFGNQGLQMSGNK
jgi:Rod binding domain-containing protein